MVFCLRIDKVKDIVDHFLFILTGIESMESHWSFLRFIDSKVAIQPNLDPVITIQPDHILLDTDEPVHPEKILEPYPRRSQYYQSIDGRLRRQVHESVSYAFSDDNHRRRTAAPETLHCSDIEHINHLRMFVIDPELVSDLLTRLARDYVPLKLHPLVVLEYLQPRLALDKFGIKSWVLPQTVSRRIVAHLSSFNNKINTPAVIQNSWRSQATAIPIKIPTIFKYTQLIVTVLSKAVDI